MLHPYSQRQVPLSDLFLADGHLGLPAHTTVHRTAVCYATVTAEALGVPGTRNEGLKAKRTAVIALPQFVRLAVSFNEIGTVP